MSNGGEILKSLVKKYCQSYRIKHYYEGWTHSDMLSSLEKMSIYNAYAYKSRYSNVSLVYMLSARFCEIKNMYAFYVKGIGCFNAMMNRKVTPH